MLNAFREGGRTGTGTGRWGLGTGSSETRGDGLLRGGCGAAVADLWGVAAAGGGYMRGADAGRIGAAAGCHRPAARGAMRASLASVVATTARLHGGMGAGRAPTAWLGPLAWPPSPAGSWVRGARGTRADYAAWPEGGRGVLARGGMSRRSARSPTRAAAWGGKGDAWGGGAQKRGPAGAKSTAEAPGRVRDFRALGLTEELLEAVGALGIAEPTPIQEKVIPAILEGKRDILFMSHTGSGKTLAYLLPAVQALRTGELLEGVLSKPKRPRVLVLTPTRELGYQVLSVAKGLSHHARFRSAGVGGGGNYKEQKEALARPIDLVVGPPGRILAHHRGGNVFLGDVRLVVVDEADTMIESGFVDDLRKLFEPVRRNGKNARVVLVAATMTAAVEKLIRAEFPAIAQISTDTLNIAAPNTRHNFLKLPPENDKLDFLIGLLGGRRVGSGVDRVMVFCNTVDSCRAVSHRLTEEGYAVSSYHGEVPAPQRVDELGRFTAPERGGGEPCRVLVCSDLAARGLDIQNVGHVVNFDFPLNSTDFLHRAGRTSRMGVGGRVSSIVTKRDQILADALKGRLESGATMEGLSRNGLMTAREAAAGHGGSVARSPISTGRGAARGGRAGRGGTGAGAGERGSSRGGRGSQRGRGGRSSPSGRSGSGGRGGGGGGRGGGVAGAAGRTSRGSGSRGFPASLSAGGRRGRSP